MPEIKEKRSKELIKLSDKNLEEYNKQCIGKKLEVLVEEKCGEYFKGHTKNYICVEIRGEKDKDIKNKIVSVTIEDSKGEIIIGKINKNTVN